MNGRTTGLRHVPGLDGLRGLAVFGVLLFHDGGRLRGGYLGVDLFFVLSGFLITTLLVMEHDRTGTIDLRSFWIRRARRLMPALLAIMPAVALYAKTLAAPKELASIRADAVATLAYVANWRSIFARRSYWEMFTAPSPLEHTWSLAIEEQFYVLWPLVALGLLHLGRKRDPARPARVLFGSCVALALASASAMFLQYEDGSTMRVYLGTDTRGTSILLGAALGASGWAEASADGPSRSDSNGAPRWLKAASLSALGVLGAAWWALDGQSEHLYRGGFWVTEVACAVLIATCVRLPQSLVARALSLRPFRALGIVSYGVYLWHWPVYVVLTPERTGLAPLLLLGVRLSITLAIAALSYFFLERPIRRRGIRWGRPAIVVPAAFAITLALLAFATRVGASSLQRDPREGFASATTPMPAPVAPSSKESLAPRAPIPIGSIPPPSELPPGTLRVLVLGDSVGLALGARLHYAQDSANAYVDQRAIGDCSILDGVVPVFSMSGPPHGNGNCARAWVDDVKELSPDVTVIVIGGAYFSTVKVDGRRRSVCHPGWGDAYGKRLSELLVAIAPYTRRRVVLEAAYPVGKWQTPTLNDNVDCYNRILHEAVEAAPGSEIVLLNAFVCPDKKCTLTSRDQPVRPDGLHFDGLGAEETARWILGRLRAGEARRDPSASGEEQ
jgi:peptidoglycan/LPS O-acetylase OafA/YrhL